MCKLLLDGWTWLTDIPAQFWGPVTAASIAVAGVLIGLYQNEKRQKQQHIFDASQKRTELQLELRREVYLELASAFQRMQMWMGQMHTKPADQTEEVLKYSEAMIRLTMVSDIETAKIAHRANSSYMKAYLELSDYSHRPRYALEQANIQKADAVLWRARVEAVASEIDKFIHAANYSSDIHKALADRLVEFENSAVSCDNEEEKLKAECHRHTVIFLRKYIETARKLQGEYTDLLVAIRVELGQETDGVDFGNSLTASIQGPLEALDERLKILAKSMAM